MYFSNQQIGETIRELRKDRNLSQEVLSGLADIGRTHLSMIETGTKQANFETLCKIAVGLNMKPSELVAAIEEHSEKSN